MSWILREKCPTCGKDRGAEKVKCDGCGRVDEITRPTWEYAGFLVTVSDPYDTMEHAFFHACSLPCLNKVLEAEGGEKTRVEAVGVEATLRELFGRKG